MKIVIIFYIIFQIDCQFTHKYTDIICQNNEFCKQKSNEFIDNGLTKTYQTPHCKLTSLRNFSNRIQGGQDSRIHKNPWFVTLFNFNNGKYRYFCGGTIINKRYIMTAAHCVFSGFKVGGFKVNGFLAGTNTMYHDDPNRIIILPKKDTSESTHEIWFPELIKFRPASDIALIETSKPIDFLIQNDQFIINSICLPNFNDEPVGKAYIAGMGRNSETTKSSILQETELQIISIEKCRNIYKEISNTDEYKQIDSNVICTISSIAPGTSKNYSKRILAGDSGSALIQFKDSRAYAIGITSTTAEPVDFYLRISKYINFIELITNIN